MTTGAFTVGGAVQAGGGVYIERKADRDLIELCGKSQFAYVLAPRQMGKSSLMVHTVRRLKQRGVACVTIILTSTDVTPEQWYRAFLIRIADQLRLRTDPQRWWAAHADLSFSQRFKLFLQVLLPAEIEQPVVIFVDEIELTIGLAFADDFFGALRSLYDERATNPALARISFVLLGAASPGELVKQPTRAPFNVGQAVALTDFTFDEVQQLAQGFSVPLDESKRVLGAILDWTAGHPYLTQCLCVALLEHHEDWDRDGIKRLVLHTLFESSEAYNSNLQEVQRTITRRSEDPYVALTTYRSILRRGGLPDNAQSSARAALKLSGIVEVRGGRLEVRNRIYRTVFAEDWVQEQLELLPNYLPRRILHTLQYAAYVLLVPLILLAVFAGWQWYRADTARALSQAAEVSARLSGETAIAAGTQAKMQKRAAEAATLALHALALYSDDNDLSLRTLLSAAQRGWSPIVDQAMRQIMQPQPCVDLHRRVYDAAWPANSKPIALVDTMVGAPVVSQEYLLRSITQSGGRDTMLSRDGKLLLLSIDATLARILDAYTNEVRAELRGTGGEVGRAVWSPDGRRVITIAKSSTAYVWDVATGTQQLALNDNGARLNSVAWNSDSQHVATADAGGNLRVWSFDGAPPLTLLHQPVDGITDLAWRPDRAQLATADKNGTVRIWDTASGRQLLTLNTHDGPVLILRWSPDMRYILTVDSDRTTRIWEASSGAKISVLPTRLPLAAVVWSAGDRGILTASTDGTICTHVTREQMLESDVLRDKQPLSPAAEERLLDELLPNSAPPLSTETPTPTPIPIDTPSVTQGAYPVPLTSTPIPPTVFVVEPAAPAVAPTETPIPPTDTPIPPTETPIPPTDTPMVETTRTALPRSAEPKATTVRSTETPITETPITITETPITETPITLTETPITETPLTLTETPITETPITSETAPATPEIHSITPEAPAATPEIHSITPEAPAATPEGAP